MTVQYIAQGILVFPIWILAQLNRLLPAGRGDQEWEKPAAYYQDWLANYGKELEKTPFYAQRYLPGIKEYWNRFQNSWNAARVNRGLLDLAFDRQTVKNSVVGVAMTVDLFARLIFSAPINWFVGGEENGDQRDIGVIIKPQAGDYESRILPRYKGLEEKLRELVNEGIEVVEIAGQTEIRLEIVVSRESNDSLPAYPGEFLYERSYLADDKQKLVALKVNVTDFPAFFAQDSIHKLHRLYDY